MAAWVELKEYILTYPLNAEARDLYDKYRVLGRDFSSEIKSRRSA